MRWSACSGAARPSSLTAACRHPLAVAGRQWSSETSGAGASMASRRCANSAKTKCLTEGVLDMAEPKTPQRERFAIESRLREIASLIQGAIDQTAARTGSGDRYGFALFVFTYGEGGSLSYISSAERADILRMLEEWIALQKAGDVGTLASGPGDLQ